MLLTLALFYIVLLLVKTYYKPAVVDTPQDMQPTQQPIQRFTYLPMTPEHPEPRVVRIDDDNPYIGYLDKRYTPTPCTKEELATLYSPMSCANAAHSRLSRERTA
jgi:hypothetical protein